MVLLLLLLEDVGFYEAGLLFGMGVLVGITFPGYVCVVVVAPFCKVVCEFVAGCVGVGVLEVYDYELFVLIGGEEMG